MYPAAITLTVIVSIIYALEQANIVVPGISRAIALLPGYELGLGWIVPAGIGMVIGR